MMMHEYVTEKLRELDEERLNRTLIAARAKHDTTTERPRAKPVIGGALRVAGRTLRRVGAGLEDWAEPPAADAEQRLGVERQT